LGVIIQEKHLKLARTIKIYHQKQKEYKRAKKWSISLKSIVSHEIAPNERQKSQRLEQKFYSNGTSLGKISLKPGFSEKVLGTAYWATKA
jgi:hypothetical protein